MSARVRALWFALAALCLGFLAYWLGVGSLLGQRAEASLLEASEFTTQPPAPLSLVSITTVIIAFAVIAVLAVWSHGFGRAITIILAAGAALVASQLLKRIWLERPQLFEFDAPNTFPSGHMTVFAAVVAGVVWASPGALRSITALLGAILMAVVSWQLLEYGWHRPSDLIGSQALVVLCFALVASFGYRRSKRAERRQLGVSRVFGRVVTWTITVAGIVVLVGGIALVFAAASIRSDELMLSASEIALVGLSLLTSMTFAKLAPAQ